MAIGAVFAGIGLALAGTSAGLSYSGALTPGTPNLGAASAQLANVQAQLLPIQRQLEAAAQQGTSVTVNMPAHFAQQQQAFVPNRDGGGGDWVPYNATDWQPGGKYAAFGQPKLQTKNVHMPAGPQTFNFSGYGQADVQGQLAKSMAQVQLALQQQYDPKFIQAALQQEQLANPQGVQARQRMNELVQEQINRPLNEPVAETLNNQVEQELQAANEHRLDPQMESMLMHGGVAATSDRGGASASNPADFETPLTTGFAGEQNLMRAMQAGTGELAGGNTPQDIEYRREQQNLANLSALVNGQTPQSQFRSLSGAQGGPTPVSGGNALPLMPSNGNGAQQAAIQSWETNLQNQANQANPWMAGLSTLLAGGNAYANLGGRL